MSKIEWEEEPIQIGPKGEVFRNKVCVFMAKKNKVIKILSSLSFDSSYIYLHAKATDGTEILSSSVMTVVKFYHLGHSISGASECFDH